MVKGDETRRRVIAEAASCVIEEGFAAASANRIAARAGVTWGVIQYHFGDRAGLLSAVVEAGYEQFRAVFGEVRDVNAPLRDRVAGVVDAGWRAYGSPLGRASLEILINTRSARALDPEHAAALLEQARGRNRVGEALLGTGDEARSVEQLLWAALRGFAMTLMFTPNDHDFASERAELVDVLTAALDPDTKRPGTTRPDTTREDD
jgi:AcrR family transcriptional regulator